MSSRLQSLSTTDIPSSANSSQKITVAAQRGLAFEREQLRAGILDDSKVIRGVLNASIKRSGASRETIADVMGDLLGKQVTVAMLNAFTADRDDRRWPGEWDRAFCKATGDTTLLRCRAEMAGLRVIDAHEIQLLELGRAFLQRTEAEAKIARLQGELAEVAR